MELRLPNLSLVVLVGCSGSGKSTFARTHFNPTEVLSSDFCRGLVSDDENAQHATGDAFAVLHFIATKRLQRGLLTVVDATNVQPESRKPLVALAREHDVLPVAIVLNLPDAECAARNAQRPDRQFGSHVIRNQNIQLRRSIRGLQREGFRHVFVLNSIEEINAVTIAREPLWNDRRDEHGPFDIIGDVHGCYDELAELLTTKLGYEIEGTTVTPPPGRRAIFLGDLVDRGPNTPSVLKLVMSMVRAGTALCVPGNHDIKLMRKLSGRDVQITHGLAESLEQLEKESSEFRSGVAEFIDRLVSHYVLDDGRLVVAHAGMKEAYQGRGSRRVREFALYGETTGETDEFGLPVRFNWASEYRGRARVVYGHTPVPRAEWLNNTIDIDTGCVFGGALTALRYPENELTFVSAKKVYSTPAKPLVPDAPASPLDAQQLHDDVLDLDDVIGKRLINTRLMGNLTVREENAVAALEVMSRFAIDPKWLIYLPPTMSPTESSREADFLEHPREAFNYFRSNGIAKVICQEKHMGSRAVVIVCRDGNVVTRRFGIVEGDSVEAGGMIYTRTGRRFFNDDRATESALLARLRDACTAAGLWDELSSDWICFDCELMPWSAKAQELLKHQYAAVGSAATASWSATIEALASAAKRLSPLSALGKREAAGSSALEISTTSSTAETAPRPASSRVQGEEIGSWLDEARDRSDRATKYVAAYRRYCWPIKSVDDLKLAPFHLLASEGHVHVNRDHTWHMQTLARLAINSNFIATRNRIVDVIDAASEQAAIDWWLELTGTGGEGMVVKPLDFVSTSGGKLIQPAVKCRGAEYLRIIYGPEFDREVNLTRLRSRGVGRKRAMAAREFSLGIEALERFVRREPLRRVHECAFAVLAMESEPIDPRL